MARDGDRPFVAGLYFASRGRAFLENLRTSRARSGGPRTLPHAAVEELLERELVHSRSAHLNETGDLARQIALEPGFDSEFAALDNIIAALLGTKPCKNEISSGCGAREMSSVPGPSSGATDVTASVGESWLFRSLFQQFR